MSLDVYILIFVLSNKNQYRAFPVKAKRYAELGATISWIVAIDSNPTSSCTKLMLSPAGSLLGQKRKPKMI